MPTAPRLHRKAESMHYLQRRTTYERQKKMSCFARHQHRYEKEISQKFPDSQLREKLNLCQFYKECSDANPAEPKCVSIPALSEYCPKYLELSAKKKGLQLRGEIS